MRLTTLFALSAAPLVIGMPTPESNHGALSERGYGNYGKYGEYGTYDHYNEPASYETYPAPVGGYTSYRTFKRAMEWVEALFQ